MTELLFLRWRNLGVPERWVLAVLLVAVVAWAFIPAVPQDPA
jgi:hypothetical protein